MTTKAASGPMTNPSADPDRLNADGLALAASGNVVSARRCYRQALALAPASVTASGNLANSEGEEGALEVAGRRYQRALAVAPKLPALHLMLGTTQLRLGQDRLGRRTLERAIDLNPGYPKAHANLGLHALGQRQLQEAAGHFRQALRGDPAYASALAGLARSVGELGRSREARAVARNAMAIAPGSVESLLAAAEVAFLAGDHGAAKACFQRIPAAGAKSDALKGLMLYLHYDPEGSSEELYRAHRRWAGLQIPAAYRELSNDPSPDRRLRIGYLSADFFDHPVGRNVVGLIENHDPRSIEVFLYAARSEDDPVGRRLRKAAGCWRSIAGWQDQAVADLIRADRIDILVVLAGHTFANCIGVAAQRAAPVQVSMHDLTTSGLDTVDWFLSDEALTPVGGDERFSEQVMRLPCFYLHMPIEAAPPALPGNPAVVFGSCNNPAKLNDRVVRVWSRILDRCPGSGLRLKYRDSFADQDLTRDIVQRFEANGISADRLAFDGRRSSRRSHLAFVGGLDIALDPFPFNGSTTTYEALWMGVPVVTLLGKRFVGRVGSAMLARVGLGDLIGADEDAYVEAAVALAQNPERRARLRTGLRPRLLASALLDAPAYAHTVETAYRRMWMNWAGGRGRTLPQE